jgi:hypothetical protein
MSMTETTTGPVTKKYVTFRDGATISGLSIATLQRAAKAGRLRTSRPAGTNRVLIELRSLEEYLRGEDGTQGRPAGLD